MTWISVPDAPPGERWFRAVYPEIEMEGTWHLGRVHLRGSTWPAGRTRCGFRQVGPIKIGEQETALSIGTQERNICRICLTLRRDEQR